MVSCPLARGVGKVGVKGEAWEVLMDGLSKRMLLACEALVLAEVGNLRSAVLKPTSKLGPRNAERRSDLSLGVGGSYDRSGCGLIEAMGGWM